MLNKKLREEAKILDCENAIASTDKGVLAKGNKSSILACYTRLTKELHKGGIDKELLDSAYEMAYMNEKELEDLLLKRMKDFIEKMSKVKEEKDDNE